jgi:hypothetical protein
MVAFLRIVVIHYRSEGPHIMNTLSKSLTIAFLAVSIFISGSKVDFAGAQDTAVDSTASQHSADPLQSRYLRFARLTAKDGLSTNQTFHSDQDSYGFMWFATGDGLNRYDGTQNPAPTLFRGLPVSHKEWTCILN